MLGWQHRWELWGQEAHVRPELLVSASLSAACVASWGPRPPLTWGGVEGSLAFFLLWVFFGGGLNAARGWAGQVLSSEVSYLDKDGFGSSGSGCLVSRVPVCSLGHRECRSEVTHWWPIG